MDFVKLLTSLEDAVYEVMVWIMQIPKTLFRTIFQPNWAISYVNAEWEKKPEERFEEYLSPVLLWLFLAVIPPILLGIDSISYLTSILPLGDKLELQEKLAIGILFALITPLTYLSVLELINKRPATKTNLKKAFYLQCYALTPGLFILFVSGIPLAVAMVKGGELIGFWIVFSVIFFILPAFALSTFYEANFFRAELKIDWVKAFLYAIAATVLNSVIIFLMNFTLLLLYNYF